MKNIFKKIMFYLPAIAFVFLLAGCKKDKDLMPPVTVPFVRLVEGESVQSQIFGQPVKYTVLLPQDYKTSGKSYPVVYLLHGFGDTYTAWSKAGNIQYFADNTAGVEPMIYVMPDGYNSYYLNNFNGTYKYMDMFTNELLPEIDRIYRTKKDASQRAVMGYSMGGYGALILPAKNPGVFSVSVPLSMSFRTDAQYIAETQNSFNVQWAPIFGGSGVSGAARLTGYFQQNSPFYFFNQNDLGAFANLKLMLACGDDEESLSITTGALHNLLRDKNFKHEYRSGNGGHSFDYWYKAIPEGLRYISKNFEGAAYPAEPDPVAVGTLIAADKYKLETVPAAGIQVGIFTPATYASTTNIFPVIFYINDAASAARSEQAIKAISMLNNRMESGRIPQAVVVEISNNAGAISAAEMLQIIDHIKTNYRTVPGRQGRVLTGSGNGGSNAWALMPDCKQQVAACFLFDATVPATATAEQSVYYYIDATDNTISYKGNFSLYVDAKAKSIEHEYRIRQGTPSFQSFVNGLDAATGYLTTQLNKR